jgi:ABC-type branched-subunit amino acid transport system substrate-binding protein
VERLDRLWRRTSGADWLALLDDATATPYLGPGGPDVPDAAGPDFAQLRKAFTFPVHDLDDGWAIMGYDAVTVVALVVNAPGSSDDISRGTVNSSLSSLVAATSGAITFDGSGNRMGADPVVVELCPPGTHGPNPSTSTVEVYPQTGYCS